MKLEPVCFSGREIRDREDKDNKEKVDYRIQRRLTASSPTHSS